MANETHDDGGDPPEQEAKEASKKSTKKAAPKKGAKKAAGKKASAKKTGAKKASGKKATAKKTTAKKASDKSAKKAAKKAGGKKTTKAAPEAAPEQTTQAPAASTPAEWASARAAPLPEPPTPPPPAPEPGEAPRPWLEAYPRDVPASYAYPAVAVTRLLDDAAADFPEHEAVHFLGASTTYRQLLDQVDRFASALAALGVGRGDRVGVVLPNCPQHVIAVCAAFRLGAVVVEGDPDAGDEERARQLAETECTALVCLDPVYQGWAGLRAGVPTVEHVIVTGLQDALPFPRNMLFPFAGRRDEDYAKISASDGVLRMTELVARAVPAPPPVEVDPASDVAAVLFTRGTTTGTPKGVGLTHANLVANAFQARLWIPDIQAGAENVLGVVPLSHAYGLTAGLGMALLSASTLTVLPRFDVIKVLKTVDRRKVTVFPGVPAMFEALCNADRIDKHDLSSLRVCVAGGAPLPTEVARGVERVSGAKVREGYGLTEASPVTHANPIYGKWKAATIGLPIPDTACVLRDLDDPSRPAPEGGPGELAVAGPQVMAGYWGRPEATASAFVDGWLLTGDVATVDEEGHFSVLERKADVITVNGQQVFPSEVERALTSHPAVRRAVVAELVDAAGDQRIKAYVARRDDQRVTDDELLSYLGERLASYKLPHSIEFRVDWPDAAGNTPLRRRFVEEDAATEDSSRP